MEIRKAGYDDIPELARIRIIQLQDEGHEAVNDIQDILCDWFRAKMESGELIEWVAEEEGEIIAVSAMMFIGFPPGFTNLTGMAGYIANMYTRNDYRGRGIAGQMIEVMEQEAKSRGIQRLVLWASEMGQKAYVKSGFVKVPNWMEKQI